MDSIDKAIIGELKLNSRLAISQISKRVRLSIPAVSERMKKLEEKGVIERYTIAVNREIIGYDLLAFVFVNIENEERACEFRSSVQRLAQVLECHHLAGEYDYMLKVAAKGTKGLEEFITLKLKRGMKGITRTNTVIVLSSIVEKINPME